MVDLRGQERRTLQGPWGVHHSHPNLPTPTEQDERPVRFYAHMLLVVLTTATLTDTEKNF